jgi:phenylpropionate dioxygenase-like ring-hydroxylating dioxygenase large terminal subunit
LSRILPVHYLRIMEQASDHHHAPFVHRRLHPRMGARVDEYQARADGPLIRVQGTLRRDGGGAGEGSRFAMQIRIPSLIAMQLGPRLSLTASATPVDARHTWFWVRVTQAYLPAALGGRALAQLVVRIQRIVFRLQDLPVLRSQGLDEPGDISGYHLLEADKGAALFFSLRRRLLREAASRRTGTP